MPSSPLASLMRQIETDLRSPVPPQAPLTPPRFDAEQYFAEGGPVHMAGGGFRDPNDPLGGLAVDPNDPRQSLQFGGQDMQAPPAGLPVGQAVGTSVGYHTVEGLQDAAKLANQVLAGEVDPRSDEGIQRAMNAAMTAQLGGIGGAPARAGEVVLGSGPVRRVAEAAAVERELSPMGFYSYGAETALGLPQAKGTPQQMAGVLRQAGVRPEELFTSGFADEAATMARRTQIEAEYAPKIEAAKQAVDALNPESPEFAKALLDPKSPESKAKRQYDNTIRSMRGDAENALVLSEDFASRPSVTREEIAAHFKEKMPQIEETVLGQKMTLEEIARLEELDKKFSQQGGFTPEEKIEYNALYQKEGALANSQTKFSQYTLPGGENYREVLLKLPEGYGAPKQALDDLAAAKKLANQPAFKSSHWQDPNVLAHLRMADRTGPNGEKILHVEEIQSDWGQKGKKEGFVDPKDNMQDLVKEYDYLTKQRRALEVSVRNGDDADPATQAAVSRLNEVNNSMSALSDRMTAFRSNIPTAPYVTNTQAWTDLALKRALREAAEGGYDKLVWTPGAEQAERYRLSNQVRSIDYMKEGDNSYRLGIVDKRGEGIDLPKETFTAKELEDYLGRDVANKIINDEGQSYRGRNHKSLEGADLVLGGEGMKGYYDKIVPNQLSKLVKKLDPEAKIGTHEIRTTKESDLRRKLRDEGYDPDQIELQELLSDNGGRAPRGFTEADLDAMERGEHFGGVSLKGVTAPSLTITPKMREAILKGQTAYAEGGEVEAAPKKSKPAFNTIEEQVTAVASDLANIARNDNLDQRHLAYLLKVASGMYMPPERAMEFAGQIMVGDAEALISRFKTYRPSIRTFARLNQMMGGKHKFMQGNHMGANMMRMKGEEALMKTKENLEGAMDSDIVRSRPAMKKALEAAKKRM